MFNFLKNCQTTFQSGVAGFWDEEDHLLGTGLKPSCYFLLNQKHWPALQWASVWITAVRIIRVRDRTAGVTMIAFPGRKDFSLGRVSKKSHHGHAKFKGTENDSHIRQPVVTVYWIQSFCLGWRRILETDSGDGCKTSRRYLMLLNCTLKKWLRW